MHQMLLDSLEVFCIEAQVAVSGMSANIHCESSSRRTSSFRPARKTVGPNLPAARIRAKCARETAMSPGTAVNAINNEDELGTFIEVPTGTDIDVSFRRVLSRPRRIVATSRVIIGPRKIPYRHFQAPAGKSFDLYQPRAFQDPNAAPSGIGKNPGFAQTNRAKNNGPNFFDSGFPPKHQSDCQRLARKPRCLHEPRPRDWSTQKLPFTKTRQPSFLRGRRQLRWRAELL
jgi:hypothetical protein